MKRVESWVQQLKGFGKKVYVGGTSQGGILSFSFAKRSAVAAMVDGIICFNSYVTIETRAPDVLPTNMPNKKWNIFTWSGVDDGKFDYAQVAEMYKTEFNQWGLNWTSRPEQTMSTYSKETALGA